MDNSYNQQDPRRLAVAYLLSKKDERPDGLGKLFGKLEQYETSLKDIMEAGQQAEKTLHELGIKREQLFGSINSVTELILDDLPEEKCEEWSRKFQEIVNSSPQMAGASNVEKPSDVDMAGSTAKKAGIKHPDEPA